MHEKLQAAAPMTTAGAPGMQLADFLRANVEPILSEWEDFARTILPATSGMNQERLRDHAREMLEHIARDMVTPQSASEQDDKSKGRRARVPVDSPAESHGADRLESGFTLCELVSEYRALRATVIRLWTPEMGPADRTNLEELIRFNEALDEALSESVSRFTSKVGHARDLLIGALGHDLRTPLSAVLHAAQFLLRSETLTDVHTKAASRILNSATRMNAMVSDLLDFSRTRLGDELPVILSSIDLGDACRATIEEIGAFHPNRAFCLEVSGSLTGRWDATRISQMLSNLLGNAVQHGLSDTPVTIQAAGSDDEVVITVHNEGPPIPLEVQGRIFEPLARGAQRDNASKSDKNLGLGLYIARQIVSAHRGSLQLTASNQEGTTFTARLPRNLENSGPAERQARSR
jgi:signal transduction histidine kinase